jgi:hypothetical protein
VVFGEFKFLEAEGMKTTPDILTCKTFINDLLLMLEPTGNKKIYKNFCERIYCEGLLY